MTTEYMKKIRSFAKWLIPFLAALVLLFGCGPSQTGQGSAAVIGGTEDASTVEAQEMPETAYTEETPGISATTDSEERSEQTEIADSEETLKLSETLNTEEISVEEDGSYTSKDEVALYLHMYGHLPSNFITKKEAEAAGWISKEGNLWEVASGKSIGGSRFGNYEGHLPDKKGRTWYECDINFDGSYRGAERIVYSSDGLIYYTADHYKTFEQLY